MAVQLIPGNSTLLCVGSYKFTMEEVKFIYRLYEHEFFSLWEIKESEEFHLDKLLIEKIACAINHAEMDIEGIPYDQRPSFYDDPSSIDLNEYRVGNPRQ